MNSRITSILLWGTAITLWVVLTVFHLGQAWALSQSIRGDIVNGILGIVAGRPFFVVSTLFVLANAVLIRQIRDSEEWTNLVPMLWRIFMIGLGGIVVIILMLLLNQPVRTGGNNPVVYSRLLYSISLYALVVFFLNAYFALQRLALYQKTRRKLLVWNLMQGMLLISLMISIVPEVQKYFPVDQVFIGIFSILSFFVSLQASWVAYLNFSQKVKVLGMFLLLLIVSIMYIVTLNNFSSSFNLSDNFLPNSLFILSIASFVGIYSLLAVLIIFFHLPTDSLFVRKSREVASFSKINQAIQANLDSSDILNTLLDASLFVSGADAGWIETVHDDGTGAQVKLRKKVDPHEISELRQGLDLVGEVRSGKPHFMIEDLRRDRHTRMLKTRFRSLVVVPLVSRNKFWGAVIVASELNQAFEEVSVESLRAFAEQAGIALDNAALVRNSIDLERYREQLKIAKEVQKQLLPRRLPDTPLLKFAALSETAEEVGGDYFDVVSPRDGIFRMTIGDISGKGTTAAFYMAELKGVFHALTRFFPMSPAEFMTRANDAMVQCIPKGSFVTLTYAEIDTNAREFHLIRAGHCPTFYYNSDRRELEILRDGALGLGILRDGSYGKSGLPCLCRPYQTGDFLVLYTDGILEARSPMGEGFGYERLHEIIWSYRFDAPEIIANGIMETVKTFTDGPLHDDHSILVVRFG